MSNLNKIADRCEAALGPDRDIDCVIGVAIGRFIAEPPRYDGGDIRYREGNSWPGQAGDMLVPAYSSRIDAASTLVQEGQDWTVGRKSGLSFALVDGHERRGMTPALALSSAALAARAARST
ncbi:MAG TPA: hypothetical protein VKQ27_16775 [Acetobacteraceae bacterium]|nr:hypothetical protein [Acetobacteraceae bacterium]